jgi:lysophospholipase L1-like esterase
MNTVLIFSIALNVVIFGAGVFLLFRWKYLIGRIVKERIINVRHRQLVNMFNSMPTLEKPIIFLGDSITEGAQWNELLNNPNVINRGIGGDTTEGVLSRLDEVIRHKPDKLFLMIGTNDINFGIRIETIAENIEAILTRVNEQSSETELFVQSVLPVNLSAASPFQHNNKGVLLLNTQIKELCNHMSITYIDLHARFIDSNGQLRSELTNDGLHLLGSGYLLWKNQIEHFLAE